MSEIQELKDSLAEHLTQVLDLLAHINEARLADMDAPEDSHFLAALQAKLNDLHSADIAYILEALPVSDRLIVWELVKAERDGEILLEVSDAVRHSLIAEMDSDELLAAAEQLDTDEIADLAPDLPQDVLQELMENLDVLHRERLKSALSYPEDTVGARMDYEIVTIRSDITLEVALRYLRRLAELPNQTDKLFVVDRNDQLLGVLPFKRLLLNDPELVVADVMAQDAVIFNPDDQLDDAAKAFERYNLVTAPVIDNQQKLVGRITVDAVMDFIREESESEVLTLAGLREEEDFFASVWKSVQNRWAWLAINLVTALIASRVIGLFEGSIEKIAALAALMPIVAGIGGNSGNQTTTMLIRGLALGQINARNAQSLIAKEAGVALLNGVFWGAIMGLITFWLYQNTHLSMVMMSAITLNLLLAALAGVLIPLVLHKMGKDPALGSSVMITAITDSGGFFIFLGLATLFLLK